MSNKNKKNDKEKNEKKKSYLDVGRKKRMKNLKTIVLPIIITIAILVAISTYLFSQGTPPSGFGPLGSEHEHAAFLVKINGKNIDFSKPEYQVQSDYIHVENGDGTTLHRHATNVTFADFLKSVNMEINKENTCIGFTNGTQYCNNDDGKLQTFVNGEQTNSISDLVINDNDRVLVVYGKETEEQINNALDELNKIPIVK